MDAPRRAAGRCPAEAASRRRCGPPGRAARRASRARAAPHGGAAARARRRSPRAARGRPGGRRPRCGGRPRRTSVPGSRRWPGDAPPRPSRPRGASRAARGRAPGRRTSAPPRAARRLPPRPARRRRARGEPSSERPSASERLPDAHVHLPARVARGPLDREAEVEAERTDRALVADADPGAVAEVVEREVEGVERDLASVEEDGAADLLRDRVAELGRSFDERPPADRIVVAARAAGGGIDGAERVLVEVARERTDVAAL